MQWIAAADEMETFMQMKYKIYEGYTLFVLQNMSWFYFQPGLVIISCLFCSHLFFIWIYPTIYPSQLEAKTNSTHYIVNCIPQCLITVTFNVIIVMYKKRKSKIHGVYFVYPHEC